MISIPLQLPLQKVNGVESLSARLCYGSTPGRTWCASCFPDAAGKLTFSMCRSNAKGEALPVTVVFSLSEQVMGCDKNRTKLSCDLLVCFT
jgi:hypothetical protein